MSLLNRNTEAPTDNAAATATESAPWEAAVPTTAAPNLPAVAAPSFNLAGLSSDPNSPLAMLNRMKESAVLNALEGQLLVNWDTVPTIKASQGSFRSKEDNKNLGDEITVAVMSWQKQWQISPGGANDEASKKLVRYSDDGITTSQGENCQQYLQGLRQAGRDKAAINERVILVFQFVAGTKPDAKALEGSMLQISLSPSSRRTWDTARMQQAALTAQGKLPAGQAMLLKLTAEGKKHGDNDYTVVRFDFPAKTV